MTDERFGDATILRVEPRAIAELLDRNVVPVVAGFQGASEGGALTTLGRGGTDLSAIAIGSALGAERVDIYTDVSGAMTADPRRIAGARTIERASLEEMTELAEHGAKVMHHKAAEYARRTGTPYAIKGLHTDAGTAGRRKRRSPPPGDRRDVDRANDLGARDSRRHRIAAPPDGNRARDVPARLADAEISIDQVTINQAGVAFVVEGDRGNDLRRLLGDLNLAVRVREGCSKLSVVGSGHAQRAGRRARSR